MENVIWILSKINLLNVIDMLLVALAIYALLVALRGTQAVQLMRGVILLALVVSLLASIPYLTAFSWLLRAGSQAILVVVAIVLQPELRRALDRIGRAGGLSFLGNSDVERETMIEEIVGACREMSRRRHGALIVFERETGLQDHIDTGTALDSRVVDDLLQSIFYPNTALHDGAVVIRGDRIVAAGCVLPLAEMVTTTEGHLGTRHRAAVGITEQTDAVAVVVSEEIGIVSVTRGGRIIRRLDEPRLREMLTALLISPSEERQARRESLRDRRRARKADHREKRENDS